MKKFLASLALAFCFLSTPPAHSQAVQCELFNESHFLDVMLSDDTIKVLEMKEEDVHKFLGLINGVRAENNAPLMEASYILIGVFKNNPDMLGIAYFDKNHCIIPGGVQKFPTKVLTDVFKAAGVEDLVEVTRS